jgi:Family of unknown function (DUF5985)
MMGSLVTGAIAMGYFVGGLFFLRFWRDTRDRLFLAFAVGFTILAVQRIALAVMVHAPEAIVPLYTLRLLGFVLIVVAIIDKNRPA